VKAEVNDGNTCARRHGHPQSVRHIPSTWFTQNTHQGHCYIHTAATPLNDQLDHSFVVVVVVAGAGMHSHFVTAFGAFKHAQDKASLAAHTVL
jgi:hypothetical protein